MMNYQPVKLQHTLSIFMEENILVQSHSKNLKVSTKVMFTQWITLISTVGSETCLLITSLKRYSLSLILTKDISFLEMSLLNLSRTRNLHLISFRE